ncbi:MAG: anthranilate phosphoribosyltransferase [Candidatus Omnitrophica bacterium]|nr:anthranilate phosphoribosyltransferase [Candidatus Omnitrophota bacterium]MCB9722043.1 anthranilate phosphoribosyltransferase [Candidatus Omnitrophota bacterium]
MELSATQEGIKHVGVGRKGSRPLSADLVDRIGAEVRAGRVPGAVLGAFLAGLVMKGPDTNERRLNAFFGKPVLDDPVTLADLLAGSAPELIHAMCARLLAGEELNVDEARNLGRYLFAADAADTVCGMAASVLRVRYETPDEYEGLLSSISDTFEPAFQTPVPSGRPVMNLAEPFDGVRRSYMITPLVMRDLKQRGFRVVGMCGRSSGPKYGNNLKSVADALEARFLSGNQELIDADHPFGWFLDQADLSPALDRWVEIRREIIKRPFLATLERFVDPCRAQLMVASAFHPPYGEKMLTICERAGYPASIVVRNGMEGTIAFPLIRSARILCSVRLSSGEYRRHEIIFDPAKVLSRPYTKEEILTDPDLAVNARLIQAFCERGVTDNPHFDDRVKVTCAGLAEAVEWISCHAGK